VIRPENRFPFSLSRAFSNFSFCRSSQGNNLSLSGDTALGVGDLDTESLGLGEDVDTLAGRDGVSDLSGVGAVVHEQKLNVPGVVDEEGLVARGHHVLGLLVGAVSDRGHRNVALEASTDAVVDTLGLAP
jgi:hypothetical protein